MSSSLLRLDRRALLRGGLASATVGLVAAGPAQAALSAPRRLAFLNLHTGERLAAAYWQGGAYLPDGLAAIARVLRDHRTGQAHPIDPKLLDLLAQLSAKLATDRPYEVISGYRSPATNAALNAKSSGVASRSLHMDGKAIDIRLPGVPLAKLRDTALDMQAGGVGYYPKSDFVHVDTGRVRRWAGA